MYVNYCVNCRRYINALLFLLNTSHVLLLEGNDEHKDLCRALCLIKDMIAAVDLKVSEFERKQRLEEFVNKIENKTFTKMKNGHVFTKQDLKNKERVLLYEGVLLWKTATGRFKGTHC